VLGFAPRMPGQGEPTSPSLLREVSRFDPAAVTLYRDARDARAGGEVVEFHDFDDLALFFGKTPKSRTDKTAAPFFTRARVEGPRVKKNLVAPLFLTLDVDKSKTPLADCSRRLDLLGIAHVGHTTWSHGKISGRHSYRIFVPLVAENWRDLEDATRQLFDLAGVEPTPESWKSPGFFVPAVHPARSRDYRFVRSKTKRTTWRPVSTMAPPSEKESDPRARKKLRPEDAADLRAALERVDNSPREDWIQVGMALKSSGLEDARAIWDEWSRGQGYGDYSDDAQGDAWDSFDAEREDGVGLGTIYRLARRGGWVPPDEKTDPLDDFEEFFAPRLRHLLRLNRRYGFVAIGQGVVADLTDPARSIDFKSTRAFVGLYAHPKVQTGKVLKSGEAVYDSLGKVWLEHWPKRRTFENVDFLPPGGPETLSPGTLNLWRGWPARGEPGSCRLFLKHVRDVICSGDEKIFRWVEAWMAHLVQRPFEKPGTAIVLRGTEGIGKGIFASALVKLCGAHGLHVTQPKQLTGNFNSHMASKLLVFADEVTWGGRRLEEGVLKAMITEESVLLEPKGVDAFPARSFCRVVVSSNNDWVVPAGRTARRFLVLDVPNDRAGDFAYFDALVAEKDDGGLEALRVHLESLDLENAPNPRAIIGTAALRDQKVESLDPKGQWLLTILRNGALGGFSEKWPEKPVPANEVYESYLEAARAIGAPRRSVEMQVSAFLREVFGECSTRARVGAEVKGSVRVFKFPPLSEAREKFEAWLRSPIEWNV